MTVSVSVCVIDGSLGPRWPRPQSPILATKSQSRRIFALKINVTFQTVQFKLGLTMASFASKFTSHHMYKR